MRKFNKTNLSPSEVVYRIWPPEWSSCLNSGLQPLRWKARRHPCPGQSDVGCLSGQWMVAPDGRTQPPRMACDPPLWKCSREMSTIFGVMYRGTRGRGDFGQDYIFPKHAQMRLRGSRSLFVPLLMCWSLVLELFSSAQVWASWSWLVEAIHWHAHAYISLQDSVAQEFCSALVPISGYRDSRGV